MPLILKPYTPLVDFPVWAIDALESTGGESNFFSNPLGPSFFHSWRDRCFHAAYQSGTEHPLVFCRDVPVARTTAELWEKYERVRADRAADVEVSIANFNKTVLDTIYPQLHSTIKNQLAMVDVMIFFNASGYVMTKGVEAIILGTKADYHQCLIDKYLTANEIISGLSDEQLAVLEEALNSHQ
jgi:hypothetical protein